MNIDAIHLYTAAEFSKGAEKLAELSLSHVAPTESYILETALGLDVEDVVQQHAGVYSNFPFFNQVPGERTIVLKIKLNPDHASGETPGDLRDHLFKAISHSRGSENELRFVYDGDDIAYIRGFVTKFESDIFTPNPKIQITYRCPYFYLRGMEMIDLTGEPGVVVPEPVLIDDVSTAPHGFIMELEFTATVSGAFAIKGKSETDEWNFIMTSPGSDPFLTGELLNFSSDQVDKYLTKYDGTAITNLIDRLNPGSVWPIMFPGETV
jgi:hypothetical protein